MFGDKKETPPMPRFATRAEAFAYMLSYQLERGRDPMEAAQRAGEFADLFATNLGLPATAEPPPQGIDKYLTGIDKVVCYCEQHPKVIEFVTGAATFAIGAIFGRKTDTHEPPPPPVNPIDPNKLN